MSKSIRNGLIAVGVLVTGAAHAAIDTATTTAVSASKADVLELGTAVFAVYLAVKTVHWVRRAL